MMEFKVGDRVAVYGRGHAGIFSEGARGTVLYVTGDDLRPGEIRVDIDGLRKDYYHVAQLRRLKPKNPPRTWWIAQHRDFCRAPDAVYSLHPGRITCQVCHEPNLVPVREVRPKKGKP